jgi:hypothetical protein
LKRRTNHYEKKKKEKKKKRISKQNYEWKSDTYELDDNELETEEVNQGEAEVASLDEYQSSATEGSTMCGERNPDHEKH